jgi:hypothetical protein
MNEPDHPILEEYGEFVVEELTMLSGSDDEEPSLILHLRRDDDEFRLRFWSPQRVDIAPEFEPCVEDLAIIDVGSRGLDGIGVWVHDRRNGTIEFFARDVEWAD